MKNDNSKVFSVFLFLLFCFWMLVSKSAAGVDFAIYYFCNESRVLFTVMIDVAEEERKTPVKHWVAPIYYKATQGVNIYFDKQTYREYANCLMASSETAFGPGYRYFFQETGGGLGVEQYCFEGCPTVYPKFLDDTAGQEGQYLMMTFPQRSEVCKDFFLSQVSKVSMIIDMPKSKIEVAIPIDKLKNKALFQFMMYEFWWDYFSKINADDLNDIEGLAISDAFINKFSVFYEKPSFGLERSLKLNSRVSVEGANDKSPEQIIDECIQAIKKGDLVTIKSLHGIHKTNLMKHFFYAGSEGAVWQIKEEISRRYIRDIIRTTIPDDQFYIALLSKGKGHLEVSCPLNIEGFLLEGIEDKSKVLSGYPWLGNYKEEPESGTECYIHPDYFDASIKLPCSQFSEGIAVCLSTLVSMLKQQVEMWWGQKGAPLLCPACQEHLEWQDIVNLVGQDVSVKKMFENAERFRELINTLHTNVHFSISVCMVCQEKQDCCYFCEKEHAMCFKCFRGYINSAVKDRSVLKDWQLMCPKNFNGCNGVIPDYFIELNAGREIVNQIQSYMMEAVAATDHDIVQCLNDQCKQVMSLGDKVLFRHKLTCELCHQTTCTQCKVFPYHEGFSCDIYPYTKDVGDTHKFT